MSTTMTMTLPPATTTLSTPTPEEQCCPNCGLSLPAPSSEPHAALLQAQRQIEDLQGQVRLLNQKATAAVDRWADYEDELSRLRAASTSTNATTTTTSAKNNSNNNNKNNNNNGSSNSNSSSGNNRPHTPDPSVSTSSPRSSFLGAGAASRISQLLSPRKSVAAAVVSSTTTTTSNTSKALHQIQRGGLSASALPSGPADSAAETQELLAALTHERRLRAAAEEKLAATSREVEDLSASLFEQANAMVAAERRARAALEERLGELDQRDREKKDRIGRLEGAVLRIERVKEVLRERRDEERLMVQGESEEEQEEERGDEGKETQGNAKEDG